MKAMSALPALAASLALAAGLALCPPAFAAGTGSDTTATQGVTSGPATGHAAVPNTAVTKESKTGGSSMASAGAGAPGTAAKAGTEAGPAPGKTGAMNKQG